MVRTINSSAAEVLFASRLYDCSHSLWFWTHMKNVSLCVRPLGINKHHIVTVCVVCMHTCMCVSVCVFKRDNLLFLSFCLCVYMCVQNFVVI